MIVYWTNYASGGGLGVAPYLFGWDVGSQAWVQLASLRGAWTSTGTLALAVGLPTSRYSVGGAGDFFETQLQIPIPQLFQLRMVHFSVTNYDYGLAYDLLQ